jgi:glycosidase
MSDWPLRPIIYEIDTWPWLTDLTRKCGFPVTLANVPAHEWDSLAQYGFDAVWLMGVWERSPAGRVIALAKQGLEPEFRRTLSNFTAEDVVGSGYCVHRYVVDETLGGPKGLAVAREQLSKRGMRLMLDFVPNHVAPDHPWITEHPEYFVHGSEEDVRQNPFAFFEQGGQIIACGKDPYSGAWTDTAQVNAFNPGLRAAALETLEAISSQCDGVRCDMAMLLINDVFERTWGGHAGMRPATEYWRDLIEAVRQVNSKFLFMAEAYWDLEWELQQQGFDYCYDKRLYDRLVHENAESVRLHLLADSAYQDRLARFIENHDEPRAAATFGAAKARAAAVVTLTLQGAKLLHDGQFEGRCVKLPVQLGRRPDETPDENLQAFYRKLLAAVRESQFSRSEWQLCGRTGWPDNNSCQNLVAWCWTARDSRRLVVVNLSETRSQAIIHLPWEQGVWADLMTDEVYRRTGRELFVDLGAWGFHFWTLPSDGLESEDVWIRPPAF